MTPLKGKEPKEKNRRKAPKIGTPLPTMVEFYGGKYHLAIVEALNVLGVAKHCKSDHCQGCEYERHEAMDILYGALRIHLDFKHPVRSYREFQHYHNAYEEDEDHADVEEAQAEETVVS
jgi:hypothetical protein